MMPKGVPGASQRIGASTERAALTHVGDGPAAALRGGQVNLLAGRPAMMSPTRSGHRVHGAEPQSRSSYVWARGGG